MSDLDRGRTQLARVMTALASNRHEDAQRQFLALLSSTDADVVQELQPELDSCIAMFFPRRQKLLRERLRTFLPTVPKVLAHVSSSELGKLVRSLRENLSRLSDFHIFQWDTFYRDEVGRTTAGLAGLLATASNSSEVVAAVEDEFATHAAEIFLKGYQHVSSKSDADAVLKATNGLQSFLELAVEAYVPARSLSTDGNGAAALRKATSSILVGVLLGFARVQFGAQAGAELLPRFSRSWADYLGFITEEGLQRVIAALEPGELVEGLTTVILPLLHTIDILAEGTAPGSQPALVRISKYNWEERRLELTVTPVAWQNAHVAADIHAFWDATRVTKNSIEDVCGRGSALVVAPLRGGLPDWVAQHDLLRTVVVDASPVAGGTLATRLVDVISPALRPARSTGPQTLPRNFARDFPLKNRLGPYFRVHRRSVQRLLDGFLQWTGVRLWCSVRRSGKTTACFDLSLPGTQALVLQTCGQSDKEGATLFFDACQGALRSGETLPGDFLKTCIANCMKGRTVPPQRTVLIVDEYETLFGLMDAEAEASKIVRYRVVQPLLAQMVEFGHSNVLILVGQRPDAHYILMDQNQLSAYVKQDQFPLFEHQPGTESEFGLLVRKALSERLDQSPGFVDRCYVETGGHPYLTVTLLVCLCDWLTSSRRPITSSGLDEAIYDEFWAAHQRERAFGLNAEYKFFQNAASQALSARGKAKDPWLHYEYAVLRHIGLESPSELACTREQVESFLVQRSANSHGLTADHLLGSGRDSNFFLLNDDIVRPKIPLLARIAASAPSV